MTDHGVVEVGDVDEVGDEVEVTEKGAIGGEEVEGASCRSGVGFAREMPAIACAFGGGELGVSSVPLPFGPVSIK